MIRVSLVVFFFFLASLRCRSIVSSFDVAYVFDRLNDLSDIEKFTSTFSPCFFFFFSRNILAHQTRLLIVVCNRPNDMSRALSSEEKRMRTNENYDNAVTPK